jgi:hypothetical protein
VLNATGRPGEGSELSPSLRACLGAPSFASAKPCVSGDIVPVISKAGVATQDA